MSVPTRIINGTDNRSVHPGDILEGAEAAEQVALGNAEALPEEVVAEEAAPEAGLATGGLVPGGSILLVGDAGPETVVTSSAPEAPAAPAAG